MRPRPSLSLALPLALSVMLPLACASSPPVGRRTTQVPAADDSPALEAPVESRPLPGEALAATALDDGHWARIERDGRLRLLSPTGEELSTLAVTHPESCSLEAWGPRAIALCTEDPGAVTAGLFTDASPRLARFRAPREHFVVGREGRTLTRVGPCRPSAVDVPIDEAQVVGCTLASERPWREWVAPVDGALLDVFDGLALIARRHVVASPGQPRRVSWDLALWDIDLARWSTVLLPDPAARWVRAGFCRDGRVCGLVHSGTIERPRGWMVEGEVRPEGVALRMHPLPLAADDLGSPEGSLRAVLVGPSGAVVTGDGVRFHPVRTTGTPPRVAAPAAAGAGEGEDDGDSTRPRRTGERAHCGRDLCVVDGRWVVRVPGGRSAVR